MKDLNITKAAQPNGFCYVILPNTPSVALKLVLPFVEAIPVLAIVLGLIQRLIRTVYQRVLAVNLLPHCDAHARGNGMH